MERETLFWCHILCVCCRKLSCNLGEQPWVCLEGRPFATFAYCCSCNGGSVRGMFPRNKDTHADSIWHPSRCKLTNTCHDLLLLHGQCFCLRNRCFFAGKTQSDSEHLLCFPGTTLLCEVIFQVYCLVSRLHNKVWHLCLWASHVYSNRLAYMYV